jgi:hypothetical protein|tara:strand:- start:593 stop:757 length:165 start_codon:yes stop_codon:yes gene_type:complete
MTRRALIRASLACAGGLALCLLLITPPLLFAWLLKVAVAGLVVALCVVFVRGGV